MSARGNPICLVCGTPVRDSSRLLYEVTGYERVRSQGGANHIVARQRTGRVVGACCAERVQRGDTMQEAMF